MLHRRYLIPALFIAIVAPGVMAEQPSRGGVNSITEANLKEWLTYIASDELQGRATYTEGLGLAAGYIAGHLKEWGVKPAGENGTLPSDGEGRRASGQTARRPSPWTSTARRARSRTAKASRSRARWEAKQTIDRRCRSFAGYGLQIPDSQDRRLRRGSIRRGRSSSISARRGRRRYRPESGGCSSARGRSAVEKGAAAVISPAKRRYRPWRRGEPAPAAPAGGRGRQPADNGRLHDRAALRRGRHTALSAQDEFFEFLFSGSDVKYADLKALADKREPLPRFALKGVEDHDQRGRRLPVVRTRLTNNVVGIVEGSDPKLKDTYVAFGAHYDHVGYREGGVRRRAGAADPGGCTGQTRPTPRPGDVINNGADDDGSGTVALMALAKAFATGPKPKRSLLFVWHAGGGKRAARVAVSRRLSRSCRSTRSSPSSTST